MIKIDALTVQFGGIKPLDALDAQFVAPICGLIGPEWRGQDDFAQRTFRFRHPDRGHDPAG